MDIGQASWYEQVGRQAGLRIPAAIVGGRSPEQSTFIGRLVTCQALYEYLETVLKQVFYFFLLAINLQMGFPSNENFVSYSVITFPSA